jgi:hypothetical protein
MTPNEREWGSQTAKLEAAIHTQRNMRMMIDGIIEEAQDLRAEVQRLRTIVRTVLAVTGLTIAALAWVFERVMG